MSLIARIKGKAEEGWLPGEGVYPSLFSLGGHLAGLNGKSGVFTVWHLGVRPQWLRVGAGADLAVCLKALAESLKDSPFRGNGGLFAAWALLAPGRCPGIVTYLCTRLHPVSQDMAVAGETAWSTVPAPVAFPLPPGTTGP